MLNLRTRSIATVVALAARASTVAVQVFGVPLAISMVGAEAYGAFIVLASLTTWFSLANLGVPNAILTPLSSAIATQDVRGTRRLVNSALALLVMMALALAVLTTVAAWAAPTWRQLISETLRLDDLRMAILVSGACTAVALPASMSERVFLALQRPAAPQVIIIIGSLAVLLTLSLSPGTSLSALCACLLLPPVAVQLAGLFLALRIAEIPPSIRAIDRRILKSSLQTGRHFLLVQLAAIAMWQTDNLLVAYFFDAETVASYATAFRFAAVGSLILGSTMLGVWPAVAAARARGDFAAIRSSVTSQSRLVTLLSSIAGALVAIFGDQAVHLWTLGRTKTIPGLTLGIGCYLPIFSYCFVQAQFLSGLGKVRGQMTYGAISASTNLILSFLLARRFGPAGICWATVISSLPAAALAHAELRRTLAQDEQ